MMRPAVASLFALLLFGCMAQPVPPGPRPADWESLLDRSLISVSVVADGQPKALVPGSVLAIKFFQNFPDEIAFGASGGGCNGFGPLGGPGKLPPTFDADGTLHIPGEMAMTAIGCPGPRSQQDGWFLTFLKSSPRVLIDGSTVVMISRNTVVTMVDGSPPPLK